MVNRMVVSVWGDPEKWREMTYTLENKTYSKEKNSTSVIGKHYCARISVFIPMSLVDACGMEKNPEDQEKMAYEYVRKYLPNENSIIMIAPVIGTFKIGGNVVNFKGKQDLFKIFSFYKLFRLFNEMEDDMELYVDLTYGINYMTMANYEAIKLAFSLSCALKGKKGKITAMNSDPFAAGNTEGSININVIETLNFSRENGVDYIASELRRKFDENKFKWDKLTGDRLEDVDTQEIKSLFMSMNGFGAFLPCLVENDRMRSFMHHVNSTLENYVNSVLNKFDYSPGIYKYGFSLNEGIILIFSALKILTMDIFTNSGNLAPLEKLEELSKSDLAQKMARYLLKEEIKKIKEHGNVVEEGCLELYRNLKNTMPSKSPCGSNNRILVAHCALEQNITYIKKEKGKLLLGYGDCLDSLIRKIRKF